jgi:hypothetical protein
MPVRLKDLLDAYQFVSMSEAGEHLAYLCKQSGRIYWHIESFSEIFANPEEEPLPDDVGDEDKYIEIPNRRDLDLGQPLIWDFVNEYSPDDYGEVREIFSRKGAYSRYKGFLRRKRLLDRWHEFETKAEERALREWCNFNEIEIEG